MRKPKGTWTQPRFRKVPLRLPVRVSEKVERTVRICNGGPWSGSSLLLGVSGTMVFTLTVRGMHFKGFYDGIGIWRWVR